MPDTNAANSRIPDMVLVFVRVHGVGALVIFPMDPLIEILKKTKPMETTVKPVDAKDAWLRLTLFGNHGATLLGHALAVLYLPAMLDPPEQPAGDSPTALQECLATSVSMRTVTRDVRELLLALEQQMTRFEGNVRELLRSDGESDTEA